MRFLELLKYNNSVFPPLNPKKKVIFCFLSPLVFSRVPLSRNYSLDILHLVCVSPAAVVVNTDRLTRSHSLHSASAPLQTHVCEHAAAVVHMATTAAAKTLLQTAEWLRGLGATGTGVSMEASLCNL